ncbi:MAG TPA: hypothetical protein VGK73_21605 [Polyangiaceae bacterium]
MLAGSFGCRCSEDRPYTPFGVTSALPEPIASASVAPPAPSGSAAVPAVEKAVLAPRDAKRWALAGRELAAPPGLIFEQGIAADFDGNGTTEDVAWLLGEAPDAGTARAGELWLYPAEGEARQLAKLPDFVPSGPTCKLTTTLLRTGPHTLTLDAVATCDGALIARAPVRALMVLAPAAERGEIQTLRVAAAAPDEALELSAVTVDRDGDGRDDAAVTVSVGRADGPRFAAPLVWLDRAFGPARDTSEPRVTLERLALHQATRAKTKKLADEVLRSVDGIRRLMSSLCAEGAVARVFDRDAAALPCGNLNAVVDSLASAEIAAELARGAVLEAFGRLSRDGWYFGKTQANTRKRLERAVLEAVEPRSAEVTRVRVRPIPVPAPGYSPLAFDTDGSLLVATAEGVVRVGLDGIAGPPLAGGPPLPFDVSPSPERRWQGVAHSCDRSETTLLFTQGAPLVTGLLAPRPGACGRGAFRATPPPAALCAHSGRIAALVGGAAVGDCNGSHPGSARSSDGQWVVVPTPFGLLLDGPAHRMLSLGNAIERPLELSDCVVERDGRAAACLLDRQIVVARVAGS